MRALESRDFRIKLTYLGQFFWKFFSFSDAIFPPPDLNIFQVVFTGIIAAIEAILDLFSHYLPFSEFQIF